MATTSEARSLRGPGLPATGRQERLDAAHQLLSTGLAEITTSDAWTRMLNIAGRFHQYSPTNILMILAQHPEATGRIAGMKLWNSLGRRVNPGQRGIRIFAPITRKRTDEITGDDERTIAGFTVVCVWSQDQTSGDTIDNLSPTLLTGSTPPGLIDKICTQITELGFTVSFGDCGDANGLTNWTNQTVRIRDDLEPLQTAKTALHEWAHCLAHDPSSTENQALESSCRGMKEVEAESIAFIVAQTLGLDTSNYSFTYIANWSTTITGETDPVRVTAERVIRHARTISTALET